MTEYYKTLGLTSNATLEEVKIAYRKLSKKFHPDVNNGDKYFEERFKEIQHAYEKIISEKTKVNSNFSQTESGEKQSENKTDKPNDYNDQQKKDLTRKSNYLKIFIPVFIIILIAIFKILFQKSISENANEDLINTYENPYSNKTSNENEISVHKDLGEVIVWDTHKIENFTFSLPSNFYLERNLSNYYKKVYIEDKGTLGLTIDIANLPNENENSTISEMIPNLNDFGNSINLDNKRHFDDFKLINTKYSYLGNIEAVEVSQSSTKVSGKNVTMFVKTYFVISNPYYYSFTLTYPINSFSSESIVNKIETSFSFPKVVEKNNYIENEKPDKLNEIKNVKRPNVLDTKKWILDKFIAYGNPDFTYKIVDWDLIILTTNNPKTAIEYTIPLCNLNIYINSSHTFSSERITFSTKKGKIKIDRDWKGFPHYESSFDFEFRFSSEDNLINRLNDALDNLEYYCPKEISSKETF